MKNRIARGQTMVLWALCLLFLSLMVLITLSYGLRVKEKMETQAVADAAALSNATVTARVFNEIALMNRGQIGQMVSMAAVESLISYSSYYRAQLEATIDNYGMIGLTQYVPWLLTCPFGPQCACAGASLANISTGLSQLYAEQARIMAQWDTLDEAAGLQAENIQGAAAAIQAFELAEYVRLEFKLQGQALAGDVTNTAKNGSPWSSEWSAPGGADNVQTREIFPVLGAVEPMNLFNDHAIAAAMGSRGWDFTRTRSTAGLIITAKIKTLLNPMDDVLATDVGSGYWATPQNHSGLFPSGAYAWGDDDGTNTTFFNRGVAPCQPTGVWGTGVMSFVRSTDSGDATDLHVWLPPDGTDAQPPDVRHTMGACIADCPGMWPIFTDYNEVRVVLSGDNYGQPKNYAAIVRDYHSRPSLADPFNLFFNFKLGSSTGGADFDARGINLGNEAGNLDVGRQVGLSTGIAYYHRHLDSFKEPPNFLNPYWRATLVPSDTDDQGRTGSDVPDTLNNAGATYAADAFNELRSAGYQGWP
jgi:hypothetical protein